MMQDFSGGPLSTGLLFNEQPLRLSTGGEISDIEVGYTVFGCLPNPGKCILVCHAFTGDQFVCSENPRTKRSGWWSEYIGPDKAIDTKKYTVICSNVFGGCYGSTGPASVNSATGKVWGMDFPPFQIEDIVRVQRALMRYLGIDSWRAVVGGSMGGMQVLEWLRIFPHLSEKFIAIATSYRQNPQNIGFNEISRQAIYMDPNWRDGQYARYQRFPDQGLRVARMIGHMTYLSLDLMKEKFGRRLQDKNRIDFESDQEFQLESYLKHQGDSFVQRFDPATYVYLSKAVDYFDQSHFAAGDLVEAYRTFEGVADKNVELVSFSSDWLYSSIEMSELYFAMKSSGIRAEHREFESDLGHDAFLLPNVEFQKHLRDVI